MRRVLCCTLSIAVLLGASIPAGAQQDCSLTVGWEPWPPYQYETEEGVISGLDGDLFRAIADEMGCELEWVAAAWKRQLTRVQSGELDAAIGASHTAERASWGRFSESYRQSANHLFLRPDSGGRYESLEAFLKDGRKLGVMYDYHYGDDVMALLASEAYSGQVSGTPSAEANMVRLASGRVDGILMDFFVAANLKSETGMAGKIAEQSLEVSSDDIYALFSRASVGAATVERFNEVLARLQENGTIDELIARYEQ